MNSPAVSFNVQRRLADAKFKQAETFSEIEDFHAAFIQLFNTTRHWAHRDRTDDRLTPVAVLDGRLGRSVTPDQLRRVFRHLQFSRVVNRHGNVSIQRFYIYAERGLARHRVTLWFYEDRLHVEYRQTLLARYHYRLKSGSMRVGSISNPRLYRTQFASPQLELLELDDKQWTKIARRPQYARRRIMLPSAFRQLALDLPLMSWLFSGFGLANFDVPNVSTFIWPSMDMFSDSVGRRVLCGALHPQMVRKSRRNGFSVE